jgi:hypothetical protein
MYNLENVGMYGVYGLSTFTRENNILPPLFKKEKKKDPSPYIHTLPYISTKQPSHISIRKLKHR